jgi:predicted transcriptional regulator
MLVVETIARIRREHFIKRKTIKEIARDLKVSRNTVRKSSDGASATAPDSSHWGSRLDADEGQICAPIDTSEA